MQENFRDIGEMFQKKREEMHLSLKEVENGTSIRQKYLQAIEDGSVMNLSYVYARGFIKQYAVFLGFDPDQLAQTFPKVFRTVKDQNHEFEYGIGTLERRHYTGRRGRGVFSWPIITAMAIAAYSLLYLFRVIS